MNIDPFHFLVAAFATYRISLLFSKEQGPARIFDKLRKAPPKRSATAEWLSCIFCFSMTGSAFVCGLLYWSGLRQGPADWFITWCALSAVTILLNQKFTKGEL
jgi:hypothetical protein